MKLYLPSRKYLKHLIASTQPQPWFREFFRAIRKGKPAIIDWYLATIYSDIIVNKDIFKQLEREKDQQEHSVLFFQWTMNNALVIPLLRKWGYRNIVCRMHGFDLYEFRHNNYIPYKADILENASICTFISEHGRNYATKLYPSIKSKSKLHYLGAKKMGENIVDPGRRFHIVSVSRAVPLKRLELIVEALKLVKIPVKWTHIGDGYALDKVKKSAQEIADFNEHCEVEFLGWLDPKAIQSYFSENGINALILVSETEGLPVVIMEAFSASIPVIATDVGGVSELVNAENGVLLNSNPEAIEVADAIELLANESIELHDTRRKTAFQSYSASFHLKRNSKEFIEFLSAQCH